MVVILHARSVREEMHIERNANGEFAALPIKLFCQTVAAVSMRQKLKDDRKLFSA